MASITIRNLDEALKTLLRIRAAEHGRSMAGEVREILRAAIDLDRPSPGDLGSSIHELFKPFGGVDLDSPRRESMARHHRQPAGCSHRQA